MTAGLTYSTYVTQVAELAVVPTTDPNFTVILPMMITYAENRIYRDLDFLTTVQTNTSISTTAGLRTVSVPVADFVTLQQVNIITPAGTTNPDNGTRNPLTPVTKEWLDNTYASNTWASTPAYFGMLNQSTFYVGPWPDAAYTVELVGTIRPDSLSATNTATFISTYLPDLMIMASMVYISAYQRNFSGMSANDPNMPIAYESQYQTLLKGAMVEEARKKFQSSGWAPMSPAPVASPSRG
jgi:hypothetical protein